MNKKLVLASLLLGTSALNACQMLNKSEPATPMVVPMKEGRTVTTTTPDVWGSFGLNQDTIDSSVHPGDDFYLYMNGTWLENFEMPADRSRYGSFSLLAEKSEQRVRHIIEDMADLEGKPSTRHGKVAAYFNAFMDTDAINEAGLAPAHPFLKRIAEIETREDLADVFAATGYTAPLGGWVDVDSEKTDQYIFYIQQGGLGLPDRDYYLRDDEQMESIRVAYKEYITFMLNAAGYSDPEGNAEKIIALETEIAKAHWDRAVGRNRNLTYNKLSREELIGLFGDFPTERFLNKLKLGKQKEFVVRQVTPTEEEIKEQGLNADQVEKLSGGGAQALMRLAIEYDIEVWKAYLTAHFLSDFSSVLPKEIDDAAFNFYGKKLRGQQEQRERWKRGVSVVEGSLGEIVGAVYAERHFPVSSKVAMDELVTNLRKAMSANLDDLQWMSDETKVEARSKLSKFTPKIGYAEKFETYDKMKLGDGALENRIAASDWQYKDMISKLGKEIDRTEWFMLPQTVNAYYSPNRNEIVFPAAILQPPFFNPDADPAINYGAIGGVIGHEIGHGFDDQGSRSDGDGVLRNWWTDADRKNFEELTSALVGQYNTFCPLDDGETCVNGQLGLGENIGDLGGLSMAYRAYQMSLDKNKDGQVSSDEQAPVIDGLTGDQRFFLAWAQVWRNMYREEALRQQLVRGPHSPPHFRVNGIVRNFDEWYDAFGVNESHDLYIPPEERIRIW